MNYFLLAGILFFLFSENSFAQDTFYVKKKKPVAAVRTPAARWDTTNRDSIISYTAEFQKPGTNVYVVLHEKGPYLRTPAGAYGPTGAVRVIFTDIVAIDQNGRRYRQPAMVRAGGVTVPLKAK